MKPTIEIAAKVWAEIREELEGEDLSLWDPLERVVVASVRKALDRERAGWPNEKRWMGELEKELAMYHHLEVVDIENIWRIALYRLQNLVIAGHNEGMREIQSLTPEQLEHVQSTIREIVASKAHVEGEPKVKECIECGAWIAEELGKRLG